MSTPYELYYTDRKTLGIKVYPDTSVKVFAPIDTDLPIIEQHLKAKRKWIEKQQRSFRSYLPATPARQYIGGESFLYLGKQYMLKIESSTAEEVKLYQGRLVVKTLNPEATHIKKLLQQWYIARATILFNKLFEEQFCLFKRFGLEKPILQIKKMEKRWGSCTPQQKIILNPELIKAPIVCINYVILHELCHLVHHNHSILFYNLLESFMPDWRKWKKILETNL
ncbi:M48 family metallopeptidase [Capnocytophaga gingivalis]|uniref:SprT family zinc-dependent metalloprotease n=1 Tax=Capnocytophaga gingivalis TaxID=1017 RepID=A0ABU5YC42_9FLAO|nr:SprT family zinc-dependent metalloprotease [Capnocytophaga gingivalis]MEB3041521.1 SprT family zinc-dependent metalloprotease [Capnocytophaga gingivalis]